MFRLSLAVDIKMKRCLLAGFIINDTNKHKIKRCKNMGLQLSNGGKPSVLVLSDWYYPGYKAGGPLRTLANLIEALGDEFHFQILTRDRDLGDRQTYEDIHVSSWNDVGKAKVFYLDSSSLRYSKLRKQLGSTKHDIIYLNSCFSFRFTVLPLLIYKLKRGARKPIILAPRGELSTGALSLKAHKKSLFLYFARSIRLYSGIIWQASSSYELMDIRKEFGSESIVVVAPDVPSLKPISNNPSADTYKKAPGQLRVLFLSRVARNKNLKGALLMLQAVVNGRIDFDIFGPIEDDKYWNECKIIIDKLPPGITVRHRGAIPHNSVNNIMEKYHLFLFPTLGENFGHVILEALQSGCPVLISDQTPWRGLSEECAGWDLPLANVDEFKEILHKCVEMNYETHQLWSSGARAYAVRYTKNTPIVEQNRTLLLQALESTHSVLSWKEQ